MMLHTLKWQGAHQVSFWPITPGENNELKDFHRNFFLSSSPLCSLFSEHYLLPHFFHTYCVLIFACIALALSREEETTIEMWAGKKRAPMPFIQGTKNMEFSCSLQHLLKATHKRRKAKGSECQEFPIKIHVPKANCLWLMTSAIPKNPSRKRITGWCHASQPKPPRIPA